MSLSGDVASCEKPRGPLSSGSSSMMGCSVGSSSTWLSIDVLRMCSLAVDWACVGVALPLSSSNLEMEWFGVWPACKVSLRSSGAECTSSVCVFLPMRRTVPGGEGPFSSSGDRVVGDRLDGEADG